ncbi:hypothetical protein GGX14DRAFT_467095, partial [Mycena pura]
MPCPLVSFGALADVLHPIGVAVALLCAVVPQKSDTLPICEQVSPACAAGTARRAARIAKEVKVIVSRKSTS